MTLRRAQYGLLLLGAGAYYLASGEWISWILLLTVLGLPWLSLALSLPAMLTFRAAPTGVDFLEMGEEGDLWLLGSCTRPMPSFRGRIRIRSLQTGENWRYASEDGLPTDHCGGYRAAVEKVKIYDYLGLFAFRVRNTGEQTLVVRPKAIPVTDMTDPQRLEIERWVPKPGGGSAENHEHRLYRPGDSMNQIHWKLSAKTGNLIVREPMEALRGAVLLTLCLNGSPEELDRKFGRLLWAGQHLIDLQMDFEIRAMGGQGLVTLAVDSQEALMRAIDRLLCTPCTDDDLQWNPDWQVAWQYRIGGDLDAP